MNYQETNVSGTSYVRAYAGSFVNFLDGMKRIDFQEERVVNVEGLPPIKTPVGCIEKMLTPENMATSFDILNPQTGEIVSQATYIELYTMLHSFYIHLATERDIAVSQRPAPVAPEQVVFNPPV